MSSQLLFWLSWRGSEQPTRGYFRKLGNVLLFWQQKKKKDEKASDLSRVYDHVKLLQVQANLHLPDSL